MRVVLAVLLLAPAFALLPSAEAGPCDVQVTTFTVPLFHAEGQHGNHPISYYLVRYPGGLASLYEEFNALPGVQLGGAGLLGFTGRDPCGGPGISDIRHA